MEGKRKPHVGIKLPDVYEQHMEFFSLCSLEASWLNLPPDSAPPRTRWSVTVV